MKYPSAPIPILIGFLTIVGCDEENTITSDTVIGFTKQTEVFGIHVIATAASPDDKIIHAANVLAEYLDSDENGIPDNQLIVDAMVNSNATQVVAKNSADLQAINVPFSNLQNVWTDNIRPLGTKGMYNEALEEILHLITDYGWAGAYPLVFGRNGVTEITKAIDAARGGNFEAVPEQYPEAAWYTYYDESCHYRCQISEYIHWAMTSILGGQDYPGSFDRGEDQWYLRTKEDVQSGDPTVYALLTNPEYKLPTVLPDGNYSAESFTIQPYP
jgi:hypothetical protein